MKNLMTKTMILLSLTLMAGISQANPEASSAAAPEGDSLLGQVRLIPVLGATTMDLTGVKDNGSVPTGDTSMKSGMVIGVLGGYKLGFWDATLESGLLYMETGTKVSASFFGLETAAIETTISYLSVPINLSVPMGEVAGTPMHFKAGLIPSMLVSAKVEGTGLFAGGGSSDIKDAVNNFDAIAQIGIGGVYDIDHNFQLQMDAAYLRGLTKVLKDGGGYNQGLSLSLALAISI